MLRSLGTLSGHTEERVWHASWSYNGQYLASCGEDRVIRIWSSQDWDNFSQVSCIAVLEEGQSRTIRSCEWSPDGKMIAAASFDGTVVIWEAQNKILSRWELIASLEGHENEVKSVSWSYDGKWIATCGRDKSVWIWENIGQGEFECVTVLQGHTQDVKFVKFHPSESTLFSCGYDDSIKIWKEEGDDWFCLETLGGHQSTIWSLCLNSTGNMMISCSADLSLICWQSIGSNSNSSKSSSSWLKSSILTNAHRYPIYSIDWNHFSSYIVSGGGDNSIVLCKIDNDQINGNQGIITREYLLDNAHDGDINCVRWNPSSLFSHILVSTGDDGLVKLWTLEL